VTLTASTSVSAVDRAADVAVSELLVPVDLSHESWRVLPFARAIARRLSVPLTPIYVDVSTSMAADDYEHPVRLRATVAGAPVSVEVVAGADVGTVIAQVARARPGSAVVMSTHGLNRLVERAWGNVCDDLLRGRAASVLAVGPRFAAQRHAEIQRVVVVIDAAAPDDPIVADALGWAEALDVPMAVVTVCGRSRSRPGEDETYHVLAAIFEDLPPARVAVTAEVLDDLEVGPAIVRFANRRPGTLLAFSPGAADRAVQALTHSVSMGVAHDSEAPMLLRWHRSGR
jgi:nucleotide-binding universal stress UspA family protein